jgi:uncharacterized membrane protein
MPLAPAKKPVFDRVTRVFMSKLAEPCSEPLISVSSSGSRTMRSRQHLWVLLVLFLVAAALRIGLINRSGLWGDEVFSLAIATGHSLEHAAATARPELGDFVEPNHPVPAEEFRRYLKHESPAESPGRVVRAVLLSDTSPPLYYLLLYGWTLVLGTSDIALRLFSIVCSLGCLPFLVVVARRVAGREAVMVSCVLFVFSPLAIYYSNEGRMYSLLWLCVLATTWASIVLHERGGSIGLYTVWVIASAAGFLTHYFFVFPWLGMVAYLMINPGKLRRAPLLVCLVLTGMLILPWYTKLPQNAANWRITQGWLKGRPQSFNRLAASLELVTEFFSGRAEVWLGYRAFYIAALLLFGIIGVLMVTRLRTSVFRGPRLLLWLSCLAACAAPIAIDLIQHTYMVAKPRYAIAALPAAYLLVAVGLASLRGRTRMLMLLLIVLAWAPHVMSIYRNPSPWLPMREIARAASLNSRASDLILVHSIPSGVLSIARYADGSAPMASWVGQLGNRHVPDSIQSLAAGRSRIIFAKIHEAGAPAPEEEWLRKNAIAFHEARLGIGKLVDFRPTHGETF